MGEGTSLVSALSVLSDGMAHRGFDLRRGVIAHSNSGRTTIHVFLRRNTKKLEKIRMRYLTVQKSLTQFKRRRTRGGKRHISVFTELFIVRNSVN